MAYTQESGAGISSKKTTTSNDVGVGVKEREKLLPTQKLKVYQGDTLNSISNLVGLPVNKILELNPYLKMLVPGMTINIPSSYNVQTGGLPPDMRGTPVPAVTTVSTPYTVTTGGLPPGMRKSTPPTELQNLLNDMSSGKMPNKISSNVYDYLLEIPSAVSVLNNYEYANGNYVLKPAQQLGLTKTGGTETIPPPQANPNNSAIEYLQKLANAGQRWAQEVLQTQPWTKQNVSAWDWLKAVYTPSSNVTGGMGKTKIKGVRYYGGGASWRWSSNLNNKGNKPNEGFIPYQNQYNNYYGNYNSSYLNYGGVITWRI